MNSYEFDHVEWKLAVHDMSETVRLATALEHRASIGINMYDDTEDDLR